MSIEQVLLIALLVVLPLIQFVIRLVRPSDKPPEPAAGRPPSARRPQPPGRIGPDAMTAPVYHPGAPEAMSAGPRARPDETVVDFSNPFDLRRAVVLMTLIGPGRADSPYE